MEIIKPSYKIEQAFGLLAEKEIEKFARVCYKSEDRITDDSCFKMVRSLIERGHEAMLEHVSMTVRFIHNRGFTHEMVRMRLCSFAQESTRYVDYKGNGIIVIKPFWYDDVRNNDLRIYWERSMELADVTYKSMRIKGLLPQEARGVLPIDVKTEIIVTANLREWRHIFKLRCHKTAHPDMLRVMRPLLRKVIDSHEDFFFDINKSKYTGEVNGSV